MAHTRTTPFPLETSVVGVSWHQDAVSRVRAGDVIDITPEPENPHDANALRVDWNGETIGHLPRGVAARLSAEGATALTGEVVDIHGDETLGLRVVLRPRTTGRVTTSSASAPPVAQRTPLPAVVAPVAGDLPDVEIGQSVAVRGGGRVLGTFAGRAGDTVLVAQSHGGVVSFPASLVVIGG